MLGSSSPGAPLVYRVYLTFLLRDAISLFRLCHQIGRCSAAQDSQGDISHFEALMTSLAGAIGTGDDRWRSHGSDGCGLGALFWMWLTAFFGMATK